MFTSTDSSGAAVAGSVVAGTAGAQAAMRRANRRTSAIIGTVGEVLNGYAFISSSPFKSTENRLSNSTIR
jgi:hypothetical protein